MKDKGFKISYVKKPFADKSRYSLGTSLLALIFAGVSLGLSVAHEGQGELNIAAWGVSSMIFAVAALGYGALSFVEQEKNYLLSKIGMGISGCLLIFWASMLIAGVR
ncbi:MAG: calcium:proton exchanger [Clostridiales bacterium]|nr:calcium:proton exchanger [Clostridiales bacterium]